MAYFYNKLLLTYSNYFSGTYVYGIMTSGDIFFWNQKLKNLSQARGIPDLVTHIPHSANRDSVG